MMTGAHEVTYTHIANFDTVTNVYLTPRVTYVGITDKINE